MVRARKDSDGIRRFVVKELKYRTILLGDPLWEMLQEVPYDKNQPHIRVMPRDMEIGQMVKCFFVIEEAEHIYTVTRIS